MFKSFIKCMGIKWSRASPVDKLFYKCLYKSCIAVKNKTRWKALSKARKLLKCYRGGAEYEI